MFGTLVPTFVVVGWSGSGGDAFPFYFRETGLGPRMAAQPKAPAQPPFEKRTPGGQ